MHRRGLGKGIRALIPEEIRLELENEVKMLDITKIHKNPYQPRTFTGKEIKELVESIKENGILQPIIVREKDSGYELVAGARRLRAAEIGGLKKVPALVRNVTESEMVTIALIENLQRENLNPIEEAVAYKRLVDEFGMTHEMISRKVGKDRTTITNILRLLLLPENIKQYLKEGKISEGHARALLRLQNEKLIQKICEQIIKEKISVREVEDIVKTMSLQENKAISLKKRQAKPAVITSLEEKLSEIFETKVEIKKSKNKGKIEIEFYSDEQLDFIINKLLKIQKFLA